MYIYTWQARRELFRHIANACNNIANQSSRNTDRVLYSRAAARTAAAQQRKTGTWPGVGLASAT